MLDSILQRVSVRRYLDAPLPSERVAALCAAIEALNQKSGLTMAFVADAAEAFASKRKTYGMFSGVRAVIVMKGPADLPNLAESVGYYGERLVLHCTEMGLGTCWVGGTFDKKKLDVPVGEKLVCVVTVGESETPSPKAARTRNRRPARSRLQGYDDAPTWVRDAMEAVRLAPSAINTQKPVFRYANNEVTATVRVWMSMDLIDLGIAKQHFALEAGGTFALGQGGRYIPFPTP